MFHNHNVLIIFVKYPEPATVKTRLAKSIGKDSAARLYRAFVEAVVKRTEGKRFQRVIFYSPSGKERQMRNWLGAGLEFYPQEGAILGERLSRAFQFAFKNGAKKVVAIGSDSPTIDKRIILDAFRRLKRAQCVIGPASDGGYYLIGLSSFYDGIFKGICWGTGSVLGRTVDKLRRLKIKYAILGISQVIVCNGSFKVTSSSL
jgi:rSAM/selenodomain-associated transferase 1